MDFALVLCRGTCVNASERLHAATVIGAMFAASPCGAWTKKSKATSG